MEARRMATIVAAAAAIGLLLATSHAVAGLPVEESEFSAPAASLGTGFTYQGRLTDGELDRAAPVSLHWDAPLTTQYFIEGHPLGHAYQHLASIRAAVGARTDS
jgi:hypothetical protein